MDRLSVLCFGGTYGLALACDLARFVVRGAARWYATLALTDPGVGRADGLSGQPVHADAPAPGLDGLRSRCWSCRGSWRRSGLYLIVRSPKPVAVGVFVLPVVLALDRGGGRLGTQGETGRSSGWGGASHFWGSAHGLLYLVGAVASCVAFAAGLMYLVQSHRLKHKQSPRFGFKSCRTWSNPSGSTGRRSRWRSRS